MSIGFGVGGFEMGNSSGSVSSSMDASESGLAKTGDEEND